MLTVFLDESGTHYGSPVVAVAGYAINIEKIDSLESEWRTLLDGYQIDELHMREFVPPHGRYSDWSSRKKLAFTEEAVGIIHRYSVLGVGAVVVMDHFMRTTHANAAAKAPRMVGTPYEWGVSTCISQVAKWAKESGEIGPISYCLDQGNIDLAQVEESFLELKSRDAEIASDLFLGELTFTSSALMPALQCADFLAYEMYKEGDRRYSETPRDQRGSFVALIREGDIIGTVNPDLIENQVIDGSNRFHTIVSLLPEKERFQVHCFGLRSLTESQRGYLFQVLPSMRDVYARCLESGEMGKRLKDLPQEVVPKVKDSDVLPFTTAVTENGERKRFFTDFTKLKKP